MRIPRRLILCLTPLLLLANPAPARATPEAFLSITPNTHINGSTFGRGSFRITNLSSAGERILRLRIDLRSAVLQDLVFDPAGLAGDPVAKCFTPIGTDARATGLTRYADKCVDPFFSPNAGGFDVIEISFSHFDPGESLSFSVDNDPTSVKGSTRGNAEPAASVSGLEMSAATVTTEFSDGSVITGNLFRTPGSQGGSQVLIAPGAAPAPGIEVLGLPTLPARVNDASQTVRISGPPGAAVRLLLLEALFDPGDAPGGGFDVGPFEANSVSRVREFTAVVADSGNVDFPLILTNSSPGGGYNHVLAVFSQPDGRSGATSDVAVMLFGHPCAGPNTNCGVGVCGDGILQTSLGEQCDDGNTSSGDCCSALCMNESNCATSPVHIDSASITQACQSVPSDTLSLAVTVGNQANRMLVVGVGAEENDADCNLELATVSYAGRTMIRAVAATSDVQTWRTCNGLFYLPSPPTGTAELRVVFPSSTGNAINNIHAAAVVAYNASQSGPLTSIAAGADPIANPLTTAIATASANTLIIDTVTHGNTGTETAAAGQTLVATSSCGSSSSAVSTKPASGPGEMTMSWTHSRANRAAHVLAVFAPVVDATTTTTSTTLLLPPPATSTTTTTTTLPLPPPATSTTTTTTTLPACMIDADCNDGDVCTADSCVAATCRHSASCTTGGIIIDNTSLSSRCDGTPADSLKLLVSVGTQPNRVLVVEVGAEENDADCDLSRAAVSYAGLPLTLAIAASSDSNSWRTCNGIFYLSNPPSGAASVDILFPAAASSTAINNRHGGAMVIYGAAQSGPEKVLASGGDPVSGPILSTLSALTPSGLAIDIATYGNTGSLVPGPGQVISWQQSCASSASASSTATISAAGATTMEWSHSRPNRAAHAMAAWAPAGGECGNGSLDPGEFCDDGNLNDGDGCSSACRIETCGDGIIQAALGEQCDDANRVGGDCCDPSCQNELGTGCNAARADIAIDLSSALSVCQAQVGDTVTLAKLSVGPLPGRILVAAIAAEENNADCDLDHPDARAFYGNIEMAKVVSAISDNSGFRSCNGIFYLLNPPATTADLRIEFPTTDNSAINNRQAAALLLYNAAQLPAEALGSAGADPSAADVTNGITPLTPGALVLDIISQGNTGDFTPASATQSLLWKQSCGSSSSAASFKTPVAASSQLQMGWSHSRPNRYAHSLAAFAPAAFPCASSAECDDGNLCTADSCTSGYCSNDPRTNNGISCDDANTCTSGEVCNQGDCRGLDTCPNGSYCNLATSTCDLP